MTRTQALRMAKANKAKHLLEISIRKKHDFGPSEFEIEINKMQPNGKTILDEFVEIYNGPQT